MPQRARPVRTVVAIPTPTVDDVVQTGEVRPHTETDLGFRMDGRLTTRLVDAGAMVAAGDMLAALDDTIVANEVRAAEAEHAGAVAAEELARTALDRQRALFDKNIVAQARIDEARANWRAAEARRRAAASNLANARDKFGFARLYAPFAGVVTTVGANPGQVVPAGQMVLRLASAESRDAVFHVSEGIAAVAVPGIEVEVGLVSDPSVIVRGKVRDVGPEADPTTRTFRVRVALPGAAEAMPFGASVTGRAAQRGGDLIALPSSALTSEDGSPAVFVIDTTAARLIRKKVAVTRYAGSTVWVGSGLARGDRVVTAGVAKLRPDQSVALEEVTR